MSIVFWAGTTAEWIKLAPVIREVEHLGAPIELWSTAQHHEGSEGLFEQLGLPPVTRFMVDPKRHGNIISAKQVIPWLLAVATGVYRQRTELKRALVRTDPSALVVHGDTFSTVLGALAGRFLRAPVAHVEAGMRSGRIASPFPEELNRRIVGLFARMHFAPSRVQVENLRKARGEVINTHHNTVVDALELAAGRSLTVDLPREFGLVTLHRFEFVRTPQFLQTLKTLAASSSRTPLVMLAGGSERLHLSELGADHLFTERFKLIDKLPYLDFQPVLARASFVVTDSGGLQQECAALGKPCAVHRSATESFDGIGESALLTGLDNTALEGFLENWASYSREPPSDSTSPSRIIALRLVSPASSAST